MRGLGDDVFDTMGEAVVRSHGDVLSIRGEENVNALAAALKWADGIKHNRVGRTDKYSNQDLLALVDVYPGMRRSVSLSLTTYGLMPASVLAACHYCFAELDEAAADAFACDLIHGAGLAANDAVYLLRERLVRNKMGKAKITKVYITALTIKAWNARRRRVGVAQLKHNDGDTFPVVL